MIQSVRRVARDSACFFALALLASACVPEGEQAATEDTSVYTQRARPDTGILDTSDTSDTEFGAIEFTTDDCGTVNGDNADAVETTIVYDGVTSVGALLEAACTTALGSPAAMIWFDNDNDGDGWAPEMICCCTGSDACDTPGNYVSGQDVFGNSPGLVSGATFYNNYYNPTNDTFDSEDGTNAPDDDGNGEPQIGDCDDVAAGDPQGSPGAANINPDATETWYDGYDQDCNNGSDYDQDGDGYECTGAGCGGHTATTDVDCDDTSATTAPNLTTGETDNTLCMTDADGDGYGSTTAPTNGSAGTDCEDDVADGGARMWDTCATCNDSDADLRYDDCNAYPAVTTGSLQGEAGEDCQDDPLLGGERMWDTCATCNDSDLDLRFDDCNAYPAVSTGSVQGAAGEDCQDDPLLGGARMWSTCGTCDDDDNDTYFAGCDAYPAVGSGTVQGSAGEDCDDDDSNDDATHKAFYQNPGFATEQCDGVVNTCGGTPALLAAEADDDGDQRVECTIAGHGWQGGGTVVGGNDCQDDPAQGGARVWVAAQCATCNDSDLDTYWDDCNAYPAVTGTTSHNGSAGEDCQDDPDAGGARVWVQAQCTSCADIDGDTYYSQCNAYPAVSTGTKQGPAGQDCLDNVTTGTKTHPNAAASETNGTACMQDDDDDGWGDASPPNGVTPGTDCADSGTHAFYRNPGITVELCDGIDNTCDGSNTLDDTEIDHDTDGFVACTIVTEGWRGGLTSGFSTMGGGDCIAKTSVDAAAADTYPGAGTNETTPLDVACVTDRDEDGYGDDTPPTGADQGTDCDDEGTYAAFRFPNNSEVCDGIDNDCSLSLPASEMDADSDTYVECTITTWRGSGSIVGGDDCLPDTTANAAAPYTHPNAADQEPSPGDTACMTDRDGDGFGDDWNDGSGVSLPDTDVVAGTDCDDALTTGAETYPGAAPEDGNGAAACMKDDDDDDFGDDGVSTTLGFGVVAGEDCNDDPNASGTSFNPDQSDTLGGDVDYDCDYNLTCYVDVDEDGYGDDDESTTEIALTTTLTCDSAANNVANDHSDCNDAASSCGTDCSTDADSDTIADCLDLCDDVDEDDFGDDRSALTTGTADATVGAIAIANCTINGSTACTFGDEVCVTTDCNDAASSCTTDCSASDDFDAVPACLDLCADGDGDDYGVDRSNLTIYDGAWDPTVWDYTPVPVSQCTTNGTSSNPTACTLTGDAVCLGSDCDDTNAAIKPAPGVIDIIGNDVDEDCDGNVSCYVDLDGDGYGADGSETEISDTSATAECVGYGTANGGISEKDGDCADTGTHAFFRNEGRSEECDGIDNDCDAGQAVPLDELDGDSDNYVECTITTWRGSAVVGTSGGGGDCNDADNKTRPFLATNEANPSLCYNDDDGDGFGDRAGAASNAWATGSAGTDCSDGDLTIFPGATERCDGKHNNCTNWTGGYTGTPDLPANEIDNDNDRYVECNFSSGVSAANWANLEDPTVFGGGDCLDDISDPFAAKTHPGAGSKETNPLRCRQDFDDDDYGEAFIGDTPPSNADAIGYVGTDCDDQVSFTFPGAAQTESTTACMRDADDDGWGAKTPANPNVTAGTDCLDTGSLPTLISTTIAAVNIFPTANRTTNEAWYDGVDQNCDGWSDFDQDGDAQDCQNSPSLPTCPVFASGGTDCVDSGFKTTDSGGSIAAPSIFYAANRLDNEVWYDDVDQNCQNDDDYDKDGDGHQCLAGVGSNSCPGVSGDDCHDEPDGLVDIDGNPVDGNTVYTGAAEVWYNNIDENCNGSNDFDQDGDGFVLEGFDAYRGTLFAGDCTDDPAGLPTNNFTTIPGNQIRPNATEVYYDTVDQNCDDHSDWDQDFDGYDLARGSEGDDCVDAPAGVVNNRGTTILGVNIHPSIDRWTNELWYDEVDQNCDGESDFDQDGDGYDCDGTTDSSLNPSFALCKDYAHVGDDCNDNALLINPDADEICEGEGTQLDNDCDGNINTQDGSYATDSNDFGSSAGNFYVDADSDTDGDRASPVYYLCRFEAGFVDNNNDCNDGNPAIYSGAEERCNFQDDDCDEEVDEPQTGAAPAGCRTYYVDGDEDYYGIDEPGDGETLCICQGFYANPDNAQGCLAEGNATGAGLRALGDCWSNQSTDCNDRNSDIHPSSDDAYNELLDGVDNDCDGQLPVVEIDCDNDGSYALLAVPPEDPSSPRLETPESRGLVSCVGQAPPSLQCFGKALPLSCDPDHEFWVVSTEFLGAIDDGLYFANGERIGQLSVGCNTDGGYDCDDNCALRCEGLEEGCDGIDNDCDQPERILTETDINGIPDSMEADLAGFGYVAQAELDMDRDDFVQCDDRVSSNQTAVTNRACSPRDAFSDCNDFCSLNLPSDQEERCNGLVDAEICDGEGEGDDLGDRDRHHECGAYSSEAGMEMGEDIYLLVLAKGEVPTWSADADPQPEISTVPLIKPRAKAPQCDSPLVESQAAVGVTPAATDTYWWGEALRTCIAADTCRSVAAGGPGEWPGDCSEYLDVYCGVVQITLDGEGDSELFEQQLPNCLNDGDAYYPEQAILRSVWNQERIIDARSMVVEWECYRTFGKFGCGDISAPEGWTSPYAGLVYGEFEVDNQVATGLLIDRGQWWMEMSRFEPEAISGGSLAGCWTETEGGVVDEVSAQAATRDFQIVGGDCNSEEVGANRDQTEGPGDMLGLYLGAVADCSSCLDGIDNNCNGLADCADPACAQCFVGQGVGCGGGGEEACTQSGCNAGGSAPGTPGPLSLGMLLGLALAAAGTRRREMI